MDDLNKGIEILKDTIINKRRHQDYDRVTKLADLYQKLFTGENIDTLLRQFTKREDQDMFDQRKRLFQSVMPSVAENLSNVFFKPLRSNRVFASIDYEKDNEKAEELDGFVKGFWYGDSDSGVDAYLRSRWLDLVKLDPNAFLAVEFEAFNPNIEKAKPFPVEYSSKEAINYEYKNGKLDWLIIENKIRYKLRNGKEKDGSKFLLYLENQTIVLTEVDEKDRITDVPDAIFERVDNDRIKRIFVIQVFIPNGGKVPAARVGYKGDPTTNGRTTVSILHAAVPFFMKELKAGSELDISMALHAFPQKLQYAHRCNGDKEKGIPPCRGGVDANGSTCPACNGTGMSQVHTTGQDIIFMPLPKPGEDVIDLEKILVYKSPDIALIQFQDQYVDRLTEKARKAVFSGTTMVQKEGLQTATAADYAMDDTYDALRPFADKYSAMWLFFVGMIAEFTDNADGLTLYHRFPNDFKLKTLQQLYAERKEANDSGVPQHVLDAIDTDIQEILYADDKDTLAKIKVKTRFHPFSGKTKDEINSIIIAGKTTRFYEILYSHFEIIFDDIENTVGDDFYVMSYDRQLAEIKKRVDAIIKDLDNEKASKIPIPIELN